MLRGPPPPLSQRTCQTIADAFNSIIRGNKGYGGGVLRIESLTRGLLYEGAWGKVRDADGFWIGGFGRYDCFMRRDAALFLSMVKAVISVFIYV
jgi:hypothetical protein